MTAGHSLALKVLGPNFRSQYDSRIAYPTRTGARLAVSAQVYKARYDKHGGYYGLHCFGSDWHLADRLPCIAWRTSADASPCALVLELGEHRLLAEYRQIAAVEPWACVTVTHLVAQSARVRFAGSLQECREYVLQGGKGE